MCVSFGVRRFTVDAPNSRNFWDTISLQAISASIPTRTSTMATTPFNEDALGVFRDAHLARDRELNTVVSDLEEIVP
ncbi:uncharacterized protein PHALS_10632 [Plasmopara halstedii]|uniref:Uncharacterized protein n=1 Tax=Plasmopara halstedii TaxID=4781 RepID=A0A0P1AH08_PLAHL|nr:uncharacterized protein PHALS_10632 [Plasmopara halstedii]CEG40433.1 hypothetical protein PHALS_10632 [Plasmopara halstedii]|eukprot:XP_024576802.1 hypothetical protein PHALS_10632 [Plasmopara halstedii]